MTEDDALDLRAGQIGARAAPPSLPPPPVSNYVIPPLLVRWIARALVRLRAQEASAAGVAITACQEAADLADRVCAWWHGRGEQLPVALTHGDYGGGNVLFRDGRIVAVLDFDFLGPRERVFEPAYTLYWFLVRLYPALHPAQYPWPLVKDLLAAYDGAAVHPLSRPERAALPIEMARVPLYWFGEAAFLPDPAAAACAMAAHLPRARWLLDRAGDLDVLP